MSQPAKTRPAPPPQALRAQTARRDAAGTGSFKIAEVRNASTMLPPRGARPDVLSLEALDGVMETEPQPPVLEASRDPVRGVTSGVFDSKQREAHDQGGFDGLVDHVISLQPYYRGDEGQSDRAQLQIDDFSLKLDNPFLASSLVPPARPPLELGNLLRVAGLVTLAVAAAAAWLVSRNPATPPVLDARMSAVATPSVAPSVGDNQARNAAVAMAPKLVASEARQSSEPAVAAAPAPTAPAPKVTSVASIRTTSSLVAWTRPSTRPTLAVVSSQAERPKAVAPAALVAPAGRTANAVLAAEAVRPIDAPAAAASAITAAPTASVAASDEGDALPEAPARADVVAGFEQIRDELVKCAGGKHGIVDIDATIGNSGRVAHALIEGAFKGTAEGSCIARAVRTAHFPRFSQASLKVDYPVSL